jgi:hypothetical protein
MQTTTHPGQAHFAGTGPSNATCGQCAFLGYYRQRYNQSGDPVISSRHGGCAKFYQLTGKHGPVVPRRATACRHFVRTLSK